MKMRLKIFAFFCFIHLLKLINAEVNQDCVCGEENYKTRIIGGTVAAPHRYPWMAGFLQKKSPKRPFCGGALLNNQYILTAAHCFIDFAEKDVLVVLGTHDMESIPQVYEVERIIRHDSYVGPPYHKHDIALIKLANTVLISNKTAPICLPSGGQREFDPLIVAGWGAVDEETEETSLQLMEVEVPQVDLRACYDVYGQNYITQSHICAVGNGKDACVGDSGGPLMNRKRGVTTMAGVVSWGMRCGVQSYPGVYTRVGSYLDWIESNTMDAQYCFQPKMEAMMVKKKTRPQANRRPKNNGFFSFFQSMLS